MRTVIFATAIRYLTPLFLVFSVYILFRGHHHPGGGFIGGLIGSIAFVFHVLAHGSERTVKDYFRLTLYNQNIRKAMAQKQHTRKMPGDSTRRQFKGYQSDRWRYYIIRLRPAYIMSLGLFLAATSGVVGLLHGQPFMTGWWMKGEIPVIGTLGTPILFDAGVYLLVLGMALKMIFTMAKE